MTGKMLTDNPSNPASSMDLDKVEPFFPEECTNIDFSVIKYNDMCIQLKKHPLIFSTSAHLCFILSSNWKNKDDCPIHCKKCGNLFTRSVESISKGDNKKRIKFVCGGKPKKICSKTVSLDCFKAYLMDLMDHKRLSIVAEKDDNGIVKPHRYCLIFSDGTPDGKKKCVKFQSPKFDEDMTDPLLKEVVLPSFTKANNIEKDLFNLRDIFYSPYDYFKENDPRIKNKTV